ncbi:MAG: hypothetical protein ABFC34_07350 [Methanobacterium sp.]
MIKWGEVDPFCEEALNEGPYFRETEKATTCFGMILDSLEYQKEKR